MWRLRVFLDAASVVSREGVIGTAGSLAWRRVGPARAGLSIRLVRVRDCMSWRVSASRRRRSRTPAVILARLVCASGVVEWHCRGRSLRFVRAVAGWVIQGAPRCGRAVPHVRAVESRGGKDLKARAEVWVSAIAGPKTAGG